MKNWKRRYFLLDENAVSYFKSDLVRTATMRLLPATDTSPHSSVCVRTGFKCLNSQQATTCIPSSISLIHTWTDEQVLTVALCVFLKPASTLMTLRSCRRYSSSGQIGQRDFMVPKEDEQMLTHDRFGRENLGSLIRASYWPKERNTSFRLHPSALILFAAPLVGFRLVVCLS